MSDRDHQQPGQRNGQFRDDVIDSLARLETKVDAIMIRDSEIKQFHREQEKRLRSLEKWRWGHGIGAAALIAVLTKLGVPMGQH